MNRERVKELLPVFQAFANGEDIELLYPRFSGAAGDTERWADTDDITGKGEYRIKPQPRTFYIRWADDGELHEVGKNDEGAIKVREILK